MGNLIRALRLSIVLTLLLMIALLPSHAARPVRAQSIDDGLVGYWPFDANSPGADLSGNGNTATLGNGLSVTADVAPTAFANTGALLSSANPNSVATAPGNGIDTLASFTIAFWLRPNAAANADVNLIALGNRVLIQDRALLNHQHVISVRYPLRVFPYPIEAIIATDTWTHVIITLQGNETNIYMNGQIAQNETYLAGSSGTPTGGVYFGSSYAPLNGILDDVRIYNRVLSAGEIAALPYNCNNAQGVPAIECQALVDLFRNTNGPKWTSHVNWLQNNSPCAWAGVLCGNGHVFALSLPSNNLKGGLPATLGNLSQMVVLQLPNNGLTGDIPFELGNLSLLQTLDLYGNQLSGQIPFTLGNLPALTTLRLHNNQLRGAVPGQLSSLRNLLTLDLGYNTLTAADPNLISYLSSHQPAWADTQTVPPVNLKAAILSSTSISLTWTPAAYTADAGYYEVLSSTETSGTYQSAGRTANKSAEGFLVNNLIPGRTYSFLVRTFTARHGTQQNDLLSDSGDPISVVLRDTSPPLAIDDVYTTRQNMPLVVDAAHGLLANDNDPQRLPLKIATIHGVNPGSQLALNLDGSFVYTPAAGYVGIDQFTYQATNGQALSKPATVAFNVTAQQSATVSIVLRALPGSAANFNFSGSLGQFTLDDITPQDRDAFTNTRTFVVPAGVYTVSQQAVQGYINTNISCNPPVNTIADLLQRQIVVNAAAGTRITCTFEVQRAGQIIAGKYNDRNRDHLRNLGEPWLNGWRMNLHSPYNPVTVTQVVTGEGRTTFDALVSGSYTVCETQQPGWVAITPNQLNNTWRAPCYTIAVAPGQAVWVRFGNAETRSAAQIDAAVAAGSDAVIEDIVVCDLPSLDDAGVPIQPARDPWEEEETAHPYRTLLPMVLK